jgi:hypothetical protein
MEKPDVSHDEKNKTETMKENRTNSFSSETILNNQNEADDMLKNLNDLSPNDSHLKRKREPEMQFSIKEKHLTNKKAKGNISKFPFKEF